MLAFVIAAALSLSPDDPVAREETPAAAVPAAPARTRFFALLESGPTKAPLARADATRLQQQHIDNLVRLYREGKSPLAGPLGDGGRMRGIVLVDAPDEDALKREFEHDPYVAQDRMVIRATRMQDPLGRLGQPLEPAELAPYVIALLFAEEEIDADSDPGMAHATALARFVNDLGARLRDGEHGERLAYGGALLGDPSLVGMFLFRETDKDAVADRIDAALGEDAPIHARVLVQYLGKGILEQNGLPPAEPPSGSAAPAPAGGG